MKNFSFKSFVSGIVVSAVVLVPVLTSAASTQTIEAIFGKVKLVINGVNIDKETLLYNGTTYLPLRDVGTAIGAEVNYDAASYTAKLTLPSAVSSPTPAVPNSWANKAYILATDDSAIDASKLIISNVTNTDFDFVFKASDESDIITGKAVISGDKANCIVSDIYSLSFEINGDEITVNEPTRAQLFPEATATYVHRTIKPQQTSPVTTGEEDPYTHFKEGRYASGSSDNAKTLVISELKTGESFKYEVIAANGKDVITEGTAKILSEGNAECVFSDDYKITLNDLKNDVIEIKESSQKLFPAGGTKFYTI